MKFNDTELPKWFDGIVYKEGDIVSNPFTGNQAILTPNELACLLYTSPSPRD